MGVASTICFVSSLSFSPAITLERSRLSAVLRRFFSDQLGSDRRISSRSVRARLRLAASSLLIVVRASSAAGSNPEARRSASELYTVVTRFSLNFFFLCALCSAANAACESCQPPQNCKKLTSAEKRLWTTTAEGCFSFVKNKLPLVIFFQFQFCWYAQYAIT